VAALWLDQVTGCTKPVECNIKDESFSFYSKDARSNSYYYTLEDFVHDEESAVAIFSVAFQYRYDDCHIAVATATTCTSLIFSFAATMNEKRNGQTLLQAARPTPKQYNGHLYHNSMFELTIIV
jgi:hypothetical protein